MKDSRTEAKKKAQATSAQKKKRFQISWCGHVELQEGLPVPPATSTRSVPGEGFILCTRMSFHTRWIPRDIESFITSYFSATFSKTW